jgi:hypothetical protein
MRGDAWRQMTLRTALMFPGATSAIFFYLNMLLWGRGSSGAVPFSTLFALCFLWFGVSVPLVFTGSYFGFKRAPDDEPVRTNKIPRQVSAALLCIHVSPARAFAVHISKSFLKNLQCGRPCCIYCCQNCASLWCCGHPRRGGYRQHNL